MNITDSASSHYLNQRRPIYMTHHGITKPQWVQLHNAHPGPDCSASNYAIYYDVIKWKHFPRYWPLVRGIHRSPVNSPHKGQWRGALMFSLICVWIIGWVNNREAGDLRRYRARFDVTLMIFSLCYTLLLCISWNKVYKKNPLFYQYYLKLLSPWRILYYW